MRFLSLCSGIDAASVAFNPLGWSAAAFAEIVAFPSAVLKHHYPDVPNLGDMSRFAEWPVSLWLSIDAVVGGTPCQAFSVAGARKGLADTRGNLTLIFVELIDYADNIRAAFGLPPVIILWENVHGVLSFAKDDPFGCLLAGLAGEDEPVEPPGRKWTNAGGVFGPARAVAWRVLDAQYAGLAQRRKRVFVVASARQGFDPVSVLFEFDGVRRDSPPSREAREGVAGGVEIGPGGGRFTDVNPTLDTRAKHRPIRNQLAGAALTPTLARCDATREGSSLDYESTTMLAVGVTVHGTHPSVQRIASYDDTAQALRARPPGNIDNSSTTVVMTQVTHSLRGEGFDASEDGTGRGTPLVPLLTFHAEAQPDEMRFDPHTAASLTCSQHAAVMTHVDTVPTMRAGASNGGAVPGARSGDTRDEYIVPVAVRDVSQTITSNYGKQVDSSDTSLGPNVVFPTHQVRRLTPEECEKLQGFPVGYTRIAWRGKSPDDCPDGPRYKALGNSWAVPCVAWIWRRVDAQLRSVELR